MTGPATALAARVVTTLREGGRTVGLAESVTAGGVSALLARVPGASAVLRGGLVVYATPVKTAVAGVDPELLARHGPVSSEVVSVLAEAARDRLGADVGLAVVGVAGPGSQGGVPIGTVRIAVAEQGRATRVVEEHLAPGDRITLQKRAAVAALHVLLAAAGDP